MSLPIKRKHPTRADGTSGGLILSNETINYIFILYYSAYKSIKALLANITNGLQNISYHAVVIYALKNGRYKIKDSLGKKYEIPQNRCTFLQVKFIITR